MKRYFYITIHFMPEYEGVIVSRQQGDMFLHSETGELYRRRLLYDFGWGQEPGFELMPPLSFDELISLVECTVTFHRSRFSKRIKKEEVELFDVWRSNLYGAVAVIMQDHIEELVDYLSTKVETDYFTNSGIRENFKCFSFSSRKMKEEGRFPGGIHTRSYEDVLNDYPKWRLISSRVISQVYGNSQKDL